MQNASSTGLPRVPEVIFQRFNILRNIYLSTSTFNFNIYVIIYKIIYQMISLVFFFFKYYIVVEVEKYN